MELIHVTDIVWDADDPQDVVDLPTSLNLTLDLTGMDDDEREDAISDAVTEATGFCHKGFHLSIGAAHGE